MNNVFKKVGKDKIQLDSEFYLETDNFKGVALVQAVVRTRKKVDPATRKPTGETEGYTAEERWYYPRAVMALEKYFDTKHNSDLSKIKENTEEALRVLQEFRDKFKDWS